PRCAQSLAEMLENGGSGWGELPPVVHALPVAGEDARNGVEVRRHAFVAHARIEESLGEQVPSQVRDVLQPLRRKSLSPAHPAEDDDHHFLARAYNTQMARLDLPGESLREKLAGDQQSGGAQEGPLGIVLD